MDYNELNGEATQTVEDTVIATVKMGYTVKRTVKRESVNV